MHLVGTDPRAHVDELKCQGSVDELHASVPHDTVFPGFPLAAACFRWDASSSPALGCMLGNELQKQGHMQGSKEASMHVKVISVERSAV